ncbi:GspH/FimT family pseudopilin [Microbulbifer salipaludis]|uniref:Type II secretion system protein H n=1 Tax=Microbulbifer salipaludis TaxID=187980 RepID=A0ABS3E4X7_9GAMM|nr:GspH/FimT family pseudopilin [Microbulbifer salipaludis]MBN8430345.1 GspH/FimT family pseudopilin [Microbulbifer salipaludis]
MGFKQRGLTLIELMITLAVLAVVVGIAVPNFNTMIQNNRSVALGEELAGALNFARSEAVKRSSRVTLCASADGSACDGDWTDQWIVIVDSATSDSAPVPVVGEILRVWESPGTNATIAAVQGASDVDFIRFTDKGLLGMSAGGAIELTSSLSGCKANSGRKLTVGVAGVLSVARSSCS